MLYTKGNLSGFVPAAVKWFMSENSTGIIPVVPFIVVFAAGGMFLLACTIFGRHVYAVGNSPMVAHLSGVNVGSTVVSVYALT